MRWTWGLAVKKISFRWRGGGNLLPPKSGVYFGARSAPQMGLVWVPGRHSNVLIHDDGVA